MVEFGSVNIARDKERLQSYREKLDRMDLKELVKEFISYLDYTEESDSGTVFHPIIISSCRCLMMEPLNEVIQRLRNLTGGA